MNKRWGNWITFGSILMMVAGGFKSISGIMGLFSDEWLVLGYNGYMLVDTTGLAVWWLLVGLILLLGGLAALRGRTWGRVVGVIAAALAAVSELFMVPYYPFWSIIMFALYVIILCAFVGWRGPKPRGSQELDS